MATGILVGFVVGRRGWPSACRSSTRRPSGARRGRALALVADRLRRRSRRRLRLAAGAAGAASSSALARTIGRAALAAFYALARRLRFVRDQRELPRWLRRSRDAGRMPLTNYLLQTLLATFVFYGWGLGLLELASAPAVEVGAGDRSLRRRPAAAQQRLAASASATARSSTLWRRFTYALGAALSANASASSAYDGAAPPDRAPRC